MTAAATDRRGIIFYVPEDVAASPVEGYAIVNRWWTIHPEKGLAFYMTKRRSPFLEPGDEDEPSPQCNNDKYTAERMASKLYPGHAVKQVPVVFIGHAIKEMHRLRKAGSVAA